MPTKRVVEAVAKALCAHDQRGWQFLLDSEREWFLRWARELLPVLKAAGLTVTETKRPAKKKAKRGK